MDSYFADNNSHSRKVYDHENDADFFAMEAQLAELIQLPVTTNCPNIEKCLELRNW